MIHVEIDPQDQPKLIEIGVRDEIKVIVTKKNAANEVIGKFSFEGQLVEVDCQSIDCIVPVDTAERLNPPEPTDGYAYGEDDVVND